MKPFSIVRTRVTPLDRANVDTDQLVPKQFLKLVQRSGFGRYLFYDWRYDANGTPRPGFVLNDPLYEESRILVTGGNFGCGSSREHAVWALVDYGFSAVISTSFADIFYSNCFKNGLLPITLDAGTVGMLMSYEGQVEVDLEACMVRTGSSGYEFELDPHKRRMLLDGLDEIAQTMLLEDEIGRYERGSNVPSLV